VPPLAVVHGAEASLGFLSSNPNLSSFLFPPPPFFFSPPFVFPKACAVLISHADAHTPFPLLGNSPPPFSFLFPQVPNWPSSRRKEGRPPILVERPRRFTLFSRDGLSYFLFSEPIPPRLPFLLLLWVPHTE